MKTLSDDTLGRVADFLKSISEMNRLRILRALHDRERSVSQIIAETRAGQSNVSKHLAVLVRAKIVTSRKSGTSILYRIADPNVRSICSTVCRSIAGRIRQDRATLKNIERQTIQRHPHGRRTG